MKKHIWRCNTLDRVLQIHPCRFWPSRPSLLLCNSPTLKRRHVELVWWQELGLLRKLVECFGLAWQFGRLGQRGSMANWRRSMGSWERCRGFTQVWNCSGPHRDAHDQSSTTQVTGGAWWQFHPWTDCGPARWKHRGFARRWDDFGFSPGGTCWYGSLCVARIRDTEQHASAAPADAGAAAAMDWCNGSGTPIATLLWDSEHTGCTLAWLFADSTTCCQRDRLRHRRGDRVWRVLVSWRAGPKHEETTCGFCCSSHGTDSVYGASASRKISQRRRKTNSRHLEPGHAMPPELCAQSGARGRVHVDVVGWPSTDVWIRGVVFFCNVHVAADTRFRCLACLCRRCRRSICCGGKKSLTACAILKSCGESARYCTILPFPVLCMFPVVCAITSDRTWTLFVRDPGFTFYVCSLWSVVSRPSACSLFSSGSCRLFGSRPIARIRLCRLCLPQCFGKPGRPRLRDLQPLRFSEHVPAASACVHACRILQRGHAICPTWCRYPASRGAYEAAGERFERHRALRAWSGCFASVWVWRARCRGARARAAACRPGGRIRLVSCVA